MFTESLLIEAAKQVANLARLVVGMINSPGVSKVVREEVEAELRSIDAYMNDVEQVELDRIEAIRNRLDNS